MKYTQILIMMVLRSSLYMFFLSIIFMVPASAQNFEPIDIPFELNGVLLDNPLIGGLIAPQFSSFDLDGEGAEDMIVFERNGNVLLPFINNSTPGNPSFKYAPEYTSKFPALINFSQFHDYNGDGKKDIFALSSRVAGIEVYRNTSVGDDLSFDFVEFNFGVGDVLQIPSGGAFTNIYVSSIDIPSIVDVDKDGDLDILTFEPGGSYMYYYKNLVVENNLPADTFSYVLIDFCWGKFFESGTSEAISLSDNVNSCATQFQHTKTSTGSRHAGSTVLTLDGDGDGDLDMILGDLTNTGLVYLGNEPSGGKDFMTSQDLEYPSSSEEAEINVFLGAFFLDVDNDNKRDLIVCPNNNLGSQNINHIWYYRNVGEDNAPIFELKQKDFLSETSLIMGHSSHPTFLDYDQDGLSDLLVGNNGIIDNNTKVTSLYLYRNIGTETTPRYSLVTDNYLGLREVLTENDGYLAPTVGDLDSDGDMDIVVADKRGFLFYFENNAGEGAEFSFENYIYQYKDIKAGSNCKPAIYDLDGDGLNDLIVGEKNDNTNPETGAFGGLNYYKNIGSVGSPDFISDSSMGDNTNTLGNVFTRDMGQTSGSSAPEFFVSDDKLMLAVGSKGGNVHIYDDILDSLYGTFNEVYERLPILNAGRRSSTAMADIDGDNFYEMIVGNDSGGLMAFNTTFAVSGDVATTDLRELEILLYPNPASSILNVVKEGTGNVNYSIIGLDGKGISSGSISGNTSTVDIKGLIQGVYMLSITSNDGVAVKRFVKM